MNIIIGAGPVGIVIAAHLMKARQDCGFLVRDEDLQGLQASSKLTVTPVYRDAEIVTDKPQLFSSLPNDTQRIFFCIKHPDLPTLFKQLPIELNPNIELFPCLNGASIGRIFAERFPNNAITPAGVLFNARLRSPLHVQISMQPRLQLQGADKNSSHWLQQCGFEVQQADSAAVWGKLLTSLGHPICALTLTDGRQLMDQTALRRCFVLALDEATAVLDRAGIAYRLTAPGGYKAWRLLIGGAGAFAGFYSRHWFNIVPPGQPSMVADLDQGRRTEIEQLNGEIVRLGTRVKMPTPINQALVSVVHANEQDFVPLNAEQLLAQLQTAAHSDSAQAIKQ